MPSRLRATPQGGRSQRNESAATPSGSSDLPPEGADALSSGGSSPDGNEAEGVEKVEDSDRTEAWNREPLLNTEPIGERSVGGRFAPTDGRARSARGAFVGVSDAEQPDATDPTTPSSAGPPPPTADDAGDEPEQDTGRALPPVVEMEHLWKEAMKEHFPGVPVARWWTGRGAGRKASKEAGQMRQLLDKYNGDRAVVAAGIRYMFRDWTKLRERLKKTPEVPTVGFLLAVHDTIIVEAVRANEHAAVEAELDAWWEENPGCNPPEEMLARFRATR